MAYQQQGWQQRGQQQQHPQQQQRGGQQEKPVYVRLMGLYAKNDKEGNLILHGKLSLFTRLIISVNKFKQKDTDPDFFASICKNIDQQGQQQNGASGKPQQQFVAKPNESSGGEADEASEFGF